MAGFSNHNRRAKRRMLAVMNAKNKKQRKAAYADLLKVTGQVLDYASKAVKIIESTSVDPTAFPLYDDMLRNNFV